MKVFVGFVFLCVLGFGLGQVCPGTPPPAQTRPEYNLPVSIDCKDMLLSEALTKMFDSVKLSYSLSPQLKGRVTVSVHNVPFPDALAAVLKAGSASARIEKGVYYVMPTAEFGAARRLRIGGGPQSSFVVLIIPPIEHVLADDQFLYVVQNQTVSKLSKKDLAVVAQRHLLPPAPDNSLTGLLVDKLQFDQLDVRTALGTLLRKLNVSYSISPELHGNVSVHVINAPFELVLRDILSQVGGAYRFDGGVYQFLPRSQAAMYDSPKIGHMLMDRTDLFVSIGSKVVRLSKKDLSVQAGREIRDKG